MANAYSALDSFAALGSFFLTTKGEPRKKLASKKLADDRPDLLAALTLLQGATLVPVRLDGRPNKTPVTLHGAWDVRLVASALHADGSPRPVGTEPAVTTAK